MNAPPPSAPEKALKRVLLIAGIDGWSVIAIAGLGILLTLALGDLSSLLVGVLVLAAGVMELRGRRRLRRRDPAGLQQMVKAQLFLLAVILVYCASRLGSYDQESMLAGLTPDMKAMLKESGVEVADIIPLVRTAFLATYGLLAVLTAVFQGGLILFYRSKAALVTAALTRPPEPPSQAVF
jgi:hypothetical protein